MLGMAMGSLQVGLLGSGCALGSLPRWPTVEREQVLGCAKWDRETTAVRVMGLVSVWVS